MPSSAVLNREHRWLAGELVTAGVDLIVVETMNCLREARVALAQSLAAGARTFVSFVVGDDAQLLSGEPIDSAVRAVEHDGAHAVLVNCASLSVTQTCLRRMRSVARGPIGACPNVADRVGVVAATRLARHRPVVVGADEFAETVLRWVVELDVELVGGCCGTTPAHIAALAHHASH